MTIELPTRFDFQGVLPASLTWLNPPPRFATGAGLQLETGARTDFWQRTHYGFCRDDGHALFARVRGDFSMSTAVRFAPRSQYDQCGLLVRVDAENWIKCSIEFEDESHSRLGSVVTRRGWSDWATQDVPSSLRRQHYRISRRGPDFLVERSSDGLVWQQIRVAHLDDCPDEIAAGLYACSPVGEAFSCVFESLAFERSNWAPHG